MSATIGDDTLSGTAGNDTISLLAGDDTALGGGGDDSIFGGAGFDCLLGNDGADTLVSAGGGSDGFSQEFPNPLSGIDVVFRSSPAFADIDDDGDLDLLVAGTTYTGSGGSVTGYSALYAYRNDNGVYGAWIGSPFPVLATNFPEAAVITLGDIDRDGDADLLIGANSGGLRVYRNDGGAGFTLLSNAENPFLNIPLFPVNYPSFQNLTLADFDGDGDDDLTIIPGNLWLYENTPSGYSLVPGPYSGRTGSLFPATGSTYLDIDGDSDVDFLVGTAEGKLRVWRNDSTTHVELTGSNNPFVDIDVGLDARPTAADVNGDGLVDLVIGNYDGTLITLLQNDRSDTLAGGAGSDSIVGRIAGFDYDYASYADAAGAVSVNLQTGRAFETGGAVDTLVGIGGIIGSDFGDSILGNANNNILSGGAGNDTLTGGAGGYDVFDAGDGTGDLVYFEGAAISVTFISYGTTTRADVTRGGTDIGFVTNAEILQATAGNDTAQVWSTGTDSPILFDGAGGDDIIQVSSFSALPLFFVDYRSGTAASGVTVDLTAGFGLDRYGGTDSLIGVTNVGGSNLADTLLGSDADNIFRLYEGNDLVNGGNGVDMVDYSGAGDVVIYLGLGRSWVDWVGESATLISIENARGGDGDDTINGSDGDNLLIGGAGDDYLSGDLGNDTVDYSSATTAVTVDLEARIAYDGLGGTDELNSPYYNEAFIGSSFNDSIGSIFIVDYVGWEFSESFYGIAGDDTISGAGGHDWLDGGSGADSLSGGEGDDTLYMGATVGMFPGPTVSTDTLQGGAGNDLFIATPSTSLVIDGGTGNDTIEWPASMGPIFPMGFAEDPDASGKDAPLSMGPPGPFANVTGIEALNLTGTGQSLQLSVAIIEAMSSTGSLAIYGNGTITFTDTGWSQGPISGDMITFANSTISITTSQSLMVIGAGPGPTDNNDMLSGSNSANQLYGLAGNDSLSGLGGNDTIDGGIGADCMDGGNGNDFFYVDNALDLVLEAGGGGSDTVSTSVSFTMPNHVEQIMIAAGVTGITITGSSGADIIIGNGLANNFNGGAGDDIILAQNITVQDILALFAFP